MLSVKSYYCKFNMALAITKLVNLDSCSDYIERCQAPWLTSFKNLVLEHSYLSYLVHQASTFFLGPSLALCAYSQLLVDSDTSHFCRAGYLESFADMCFIIMVVMLLTARNSRYYSISSGINMSYY